MNFIKYIIPEETEKYVPEIKKKPKKTIEESKNTEEKIQRSGRRVKLRYLEKHLKYILAKADVVVFWMDYDKAGENIWFQIIELIQENFKDFDLNNLFRVEFSSLNSHDIKEAFKNVMKKPDRLLAENLYAKQEIDLRVGYAFSLLNNTK